MRILIVNTDYPGFLERLYAGSPGLERASFAEQDRVRNETLFGETDSYSLGFRQHGADAWEVHANNPLLQTAWAKEHGVSSYTSTPLLDVKERLRKRLFGKRLAPVLLHILAAQITHFRPDVILNKDMHLVPASFLGRQIKSKGLVVGQIAAPLPDRSKLAGYGLIISSLPNLVAWFKASGLTAELCRLSFDQRILEQVQPRSDRRGVLFVGSLSADHGGRLTLLEHLSRNLDEFEIWGAGIERIAGDSPIRRRYKGEAWGKDMYRLLAGASIALNSHIDMAEGHANNFRLYEATGMGALLLTDGIKDLRVIFKPGHEAVAYATPDDCLHAIRKLLAEPATLRRIADAGHQRTLKDHNTTKRMGELLSIIEGHRGRMS